MRVLIIDDGYPSDDNLYADVFVHIRVKEYVKHHTCVVVSFTAEKDYVFDGTEVKSLQTADDFARFYGSFRPDIVLVHFALKWFIESVFPKIAVPIIVWIHGHEALGWYRRLFNYRLKEIFTFTFLATIRSNFSQEKTLRNLIKLSNRKEKKVHFVFVSEWMKRICETDAMIRVKNHSIVPNPIDDSVFRYGKKSPELRKKIFSIRSFYSNKYANDITLEAIRILSAKPFFSDLEFNIYGDGRLWQKLRSNFPDFDNVHWHKKFLRQEEIVEMHQLHGIILCPTRQDAQGVSMCEAMASGIVPVTSHNTAIPEFVENGQTGFTTKSPAEIAERIEFLYHHPDDFLRMSANASSFIVAKAGIEKVIRDELQLMADCTLK